MEEGPRLTAFESSIARATRQIVSGIPKRQRPSEEGIRRFSEDTAIVVAGFRMAHLVDAIFIPLSLVEPLGLELRKVSEHFLNLSLLSISEGSQLFVVNLTLLKEACQTVSAHPWTQVIGLPPRPPPVLLSASNADPIGFLVSRIFELCTAESSLPAIHLNQDSSGNPRPALLMALAGWLLEYPFAYLPINEEAAAENGDSNFGERLEGVELNVFSCYVASSEAQHRRQFIKFSCPSSCLNSSSKPEEGGERSVVDRIVARWKTRLPANSDWNIEVEVETKVLDRVSL